MVPDCTLAWSAVEFPPCFSAFTRSSTWASSSLLGSSTSAWTSGVSPRTCDQRLMCPGLWCLGAGSERSWHGWLGAHGTRLGSSAAHWLAESSTAQLSLTLASCCTNLLIVVLFLQLVSFSYFWLCFTVWGRLFFHWESYFKSFLGLSRYRYPRVPARMGQLYLLGCFCPQTLSFVNWLQKKGCPLWCV